MTQRNEKFYHIVNLRRFQRSFIELTSHRLLHLRNLVVLEFEDLMLGLPDTQFLLQVAEFDELEFVAALVVAAGDLRRSRIAHRFRGSPRHRRRRERRLVVRSMIGQSSLRVVSLDARPRRRLLLLLSLRQFSLQIVLLPLQFFSSVLILALQIDLALLRDIELVLEMFYSIVEGFYFVLLVGDLRQKLSILDDLLLKFLDINVIRRRYWLILVLRRLASAFLGLVLHPIQLLLKERHPLGQLLVSERQAVQLLLRSSNLHLPLLELLSYLSVTTLLLYHRFLQDVRLCSDLEYLTINQIEIID